MNIKNITLRAQLNTVIIAVLLISFTASVWINISNTQTFLKNQLAQHAQDTASSLGLSLSEPIFDEEKIVVEATINAIFDRGFFHHITLEGIDGHIIYKRAQENQPEQVPSWFIELFSLQAPERQSMVDTGWTIVGILKVQAHTGIAYLQLWESARQMTLYILLTFVFALTLAYLFLREIYKPIHDIKLQSIAVQKRQFIMIEKLPRALELRHFVLAMNKMVANIKNTFEELTQAAADTHHDAYIDQQTGIENRRAFIDSIEAMVAPTEEHSGYILMARITELSTLNQKHGYQAGDNLVMQLIVQIQILIKENREIKLFRISGSEFCLIVENYQLSDIQKLLADIIEQIKLHIEHPDAVNIVLGCIDFNSGQNFADLMFELDMATNLAVEGSEGFYIKQPDQVNSVGSIINYKIVLDEVLQNPAAHIQLTSQRVFSCSSRPVFEHEIFVAFQYDDKRVNTGDLFAIASQYQQTGLLDLTIVKLILAHCNNSLLKGKQIAINLSRLTISDSQSMDHIITLIEHSAHARVLSIGFPESSILGHIRDTKRYIERFSDAGCTICINRFGSSMESLQYLMELRPDHVKLSPAFTRNIDNKDSNSQMVGAFVRLVHGLDMSVIAQCVETEQELQTLQKLNIDALLGYVFEKPERLS